MISPAAGVPGDMATKPVDFRKGPDSLAALVASQFGGDPYSGVIYAFRAKSTVRIKMIWWDGTGLCLLAKRLEQGGFKWPGIQDGVMRLTAAQLGALLEGLDWRRVHGGRDRAVSNAAGARSLRAMAIETVAGADCGLVGFCRRGRAVAPREPREFKRLHVDHGS